MSEQGNRKAALQAKYRAMPTEELEQLVRMDSEGPEAADTEVILCVMEELAKRNALKDTENSGNKAQKAWESFLRDYLPGAEEQPATKKSAPWLRRLAAVAAVLVLLVGATVTANAFGFTDLWNVIATWAKETFSFVSGDRERPSEPTPTDTLEYASFQQAIREITGMTDLVPTQFPEGFVLDDITVEDLPGKRMYRAIYKNREQQFAIYMLPYTAADSLWLEKSGQPVEAYEAAGVECFIFYNNDQYSAAWQKDSYECYISGDLTIVQIKTMIDSIGKG